jgi:hypothetical protein
MRSWRLLCNTTARNVLACALAAPVIKISARATREFACQRARLRLNFVALRPDETEIAPQRASNPANVGKAG